MKGKIKKDNNFYKETNKKIRNQNNEDQIRKHNTVNLNWRITLKTNKLLQKSQWKKIKNLKNEDQIEKYNIW